VVRSRAVRLVLEHEHEHPSPKLDVQTYVPEARALRGDPMKRTCPTWHGGVAYQPTAYNPVKQIAYGVGAEGCFSGNGAAAAFMTSDSLSGPTFAPGRYPYSPGSGSRTSEPGLLSSIRRSSGARTCTTVRNGLIVTATVDGIAAREACSGACTGRSAGSPP
jgi:hypothetical protein